jgi:hypothetical protein
LVSTHEKKNMPLRLEGRKKSRKKRRRKKEEKRKQ